MSKYNWNSKGPGGCDSHNIEHPCGRCITGKSSESQTNSERLKRLEDIEATPDNRPGDRIMILLKDFDYLCSELRKSISGETVSDSCQKREETKNIGAESVKPKEFKFCPQCNYPDYDGHRCIDLLNAEIAQLEVERDQLLTSVVSSNKLVEELKAELEQVKQFNAAPTFALVEKCKELRAQCDRLAEDIRGMEGFATKSPALAEYEKSKGEHD